MLNVCPSFALIVSDDSYKSKGAIFMRQIVQTWEHFFQTITDTNSWWARKKALFQKRRLKLIRIDAKGRVDRLYNSHQYSVYEYIFHVSFLLRDPLKKFYIEEMIVPYYVKQHHKKIIEHQLIQPKNLKRPSTVNDTILQLIPTQKRYERLAAVRYAERWWNSINPLFSKLNDHHASFILQCLMSGFGQSMISDDERIMQKAKGLLTPYSLRWYLSHPNNQATIQEVASVKELKLGDIICYDFHGADKWEQIAIVTGKDDAKMPLVHTCFENRCHRYRYWSYEDSFLWSNKTTYKFFHIV